MTDAPVQRQLISGVWSDADILRTGLDGEPRWIEHASDGRRWTPQRASAPEEIERALDAASNLHRSGEWRTARLDDRADALDAMAGHLVGSVDDVARLESIESGATIGVTSMFGFILHGAFTLAAAQLRAGVLSSRVDGPTGREVEIDRLPWGPALLLCPWNAPAPMAAHKAASALAAGAPVIIKPPERAPHGTEAIGAAALAAGLPPGAVQIVHGGPEVAGPVMADDRVAAVSFTGGIEGGRAVAHACAEGLKPAQLELGGHSPLVVMPDASAEAAAEAARGLLTTINGQWCRGLGRLILPATRRDELFEAIVAALSDVTVGDPLDPANDMGPICHSEHVATIESQLDALRSAGGSTVTTAVVPDAPGNWMSPTLVTGLDVAATDNEIFGPVASVLAYDSVESAVTMANQTRYGLEAYVVGSDEDEAMAVGRRIRAGGVKVNGVSPISLNLMAPRPAFGVSGLAEEGTVETILFFGGNRVVGVESSLGTGGPPG